MEAPAQSLLEDSALSPLYFAAFVENPLLHVPAFVVVTRLLSLFGQRFGLGHRAPGLVEKLLPRSAVGKRGLKQRHVGLPFLLLAQNQRLRLLPHVLRRWLVRWSSQILRQSLIQLVGKLRIA